MDVLTLDDVYYNHKNALTRAIVKLAGSGIGIKAQGLSEIQTIKLEEIKECVEYYGVVAHVLRVTKKNGAVYIIDGISADSLENIKQYAKKHYKMNVYNRQLAVDGNVHGKIDVLDAYVEMKKGEKTLFEIPLSAISNAYERRGEGIIDINETYYGTTEIRFGSLREENSVYTLVEQIKSITDEGDQTEVLSIEEVMCALPRGKSKLALTSSSIHLIGKTYSHQILFESIQRIFFLERNTEEAEEDMMYLVLELKTPIRQGQTRYYFVNMLLPTDQVKVVLGKNSVIEYEDEDSVSVVSQEEGVKRPKSAEETPEEEKEAGTPEVEQVPEQTLIPDPEEEKKLESLGLSLQYRDGLAECFLQVLQTLSKLTAVQTDVFRTSTENKSLKCSSKANEGYLYPLRKGFFFIPKIAYIEYSRISVVEFSRVNLSARTAKTFDVRIIMEDKKEHMFNGLQKTEFSAFETYLETKNVKCRSEVGEEAYAPHHAAEEDSDEETVSEGTSTEEESEEEEEGSAKSDDESAYNTDNDSAVSSPCDTESE
ncbi:structure-specific recognition protein 1 [Nematocida sp. AWRm77]|nr:structure-specific recognition protein 1 [Nematocida sp. AWRm77]